MHTIHPHHHHLVSWLCRELFLIHISCQSSHLECECQERRKKSFFCRSLKPRKEKGTPYMWMEIKDQHPSFKSRTVLRSTIPWHQNMPSFSLYPVQRPQTTLQTHLFLAYHVSHCIFFPLFPVSSFLFFSHSYWVNLLWERMPQFFKWGKCYAQLFVALIQ